MAASGPNGSMELSTTNGTKLESTFPTITETTEADINLTLATQPIPGTNWSTPFFSSWSPTTPDAGGSYGGYVVLGVIIALVVIGIVACCVRSLKNKRWFRMHWRTLAGRSKNKNDLHSNELFKDCVYVDVVRATEIEMKEIASDDEPSYITVEFVPNNKQKYLSPTRIVDEETEEVQL